MVVVVVVVVAGRIGSDRCKTGSDEDIICIALRKYQLQ